MAADSDAEELKCRGAERGIEEEEEEEWEVSCGVSATVVDASKGVIVAVVLDDSASMLGVLSFIVPEEASSFVLL